MYSFVVIGQKDLLYPAPNFLKRYLRHLMDEVIMLHIKRCAFIDCIEVIRVKVTGTSYHLQTLW